MAYNPGVSFFIPFHELDPSKESQCIFFTQKGARCRWACRESDNRRAIVLHKTINAISSEAVGLDLLQDPTRQDEIRRHTDHTTSVPALEKSVFTPYTHTTLATPSPSDTTTLYTPIESPFYYQLNAPRSFSINATPSKPVASSPYFQHGSSGFPTTTKFGFQPFESQSHYDLRPRKANISTNSTSTQPKFISQPPQSEFRPHLADPLPSDSVSWKILNPLEDRDFETGSLYIFDQASSPGHVKIGWTARSVSRRLEGWSKCGYKPNLLFSVHCVPHAQRVETLTHHELIKEWRRERMCKAPWCGKSHQEWFEINKERAEQVLGNWADFMKRAEPYDPEGRLKNRWRVAIKMIDRNGEVVTAKKLLECYEESLVKEAALVKEPVDLGHELKIEEEVGFGSRPKVERSETLEETPVRMSSLRIEEPTLPKETPLRKSAALPKQTPLVEIPLPKAETQPKSDPLLKTKPIPKTEQLFQTEQLSTNEPLSQTEPQFRSKPPCKKLSPAKTMLFKPEPPLKTQFSFTAEQSFKIEPSSKTGPLFRAESLFKTKPLPKSEPVHEEVSASQTTPVKKELPPEQIPLPPSPPLQPTKHTSLIRDKAKSKHRNRGD